MAQSHATSPEWVHLGEQDEVIWESRPHTIALGRGFLWGVGILLLGILAGWFLGSEIGQAAWILGGLIALSGLGLATGSALVWLNTRYVITSTDLYAKRGVVSRDISQVRLDRIQNTNLEQSIMGRILGYGTLAVYSAGSDSPELTFERVPHPRQASAVVADQIG